MKYDKNVREEWNSFIPKQSIRGRIIHLIKKVIFREKADSKTYINYLRKKGAKIGKGTYFYVVKKTSIDTTNPQLLEIGDNVRILEGVTILTHDFSWSVLSGIEGNMLGSNENVKIGNNVFLGMKSTI